MQIISKVENANKLFSSEEALRSSSTKSNNVFVLVQVKDPILESEVGKSLK